LKQKAAVMKFDTSRLLANFSLTSF